MGLRLTYATKQIHTAQHSKHIIQSLLKSVSGQRFWKVLWLAQIHCISHLLEPPNVEVQYTHLLGHFITEIISLSWDVVHSNGNPGTIVKDQIAMEKDAFL
jgi:hypothetical protein